MATCRICGIDKPKTLTAKCYFEQEPESIQPVCDDCFNRASITCPACQKDQTIFEAIFGNGGLYIDKENHIFHKKCFEKVFKWKTKW